MLAKLSLLFPTFARQERAENKKRTTYQQWINIDRVVMAGLFISVIVLAIVFSD